MATQTIVVHLEESTAAAVVRVERRSRAGHAGPFSAPFDEGLCDDLSRMWARVRPHHWKRYRREMQAIGSRLFQLTLGASDATRALFLETLQDVLQRRQDGHADILKVVLSCSEGRLERLPWELLFDSTAKPLAGFLGATEYISIQRQGALSKAGGWPSDRPLRLLTVLAAPVFSPAGLRMGLYDPPVDTLAVSRFLERLEQRSQPVLTAKLLYGQDANPEALRKALAAPFDVLYFIGHSQQFGNQTWFLLEDGSPLRRSIKLSAAELAEMLRASGVKCVFLSSCDSAASAAVLARFEHLHSVVAMQAPMPDFAASAYDEAVITSLVARCSVERSVLHGKQTVLDLVRRLVTSEEWEPRDRPEWAIPVLYAADSDADIASTAFEHTSYRVGVADDHVEALERCGWKGALPLEVVDCFQEAASRTLSAFSIAHCLVTNDQYRYYLEHAHADLPPGFERHGDCVELGRLPGALKSLRPGDAVTHISRTQAEECCRWFGKRLPSADEVDASSKVLKRSLSGRLFEWTSDWRTDGDGTMAVVVGSQDDVPHTWLHGFRGLRDPNAAYQNVGFRMADDIRPGVQVGKPVP